MCLSTTLIFQFLWLRGVFMALRGPSLAGGERGPLLVVVSGLLLVGVSLVAEHGL